MKKIRLLLTYGLMVLASCTKDKEEVFTGEVISVDSNKSPKSGMMSEMVDVVRYIPLETNENTLFGEVTKFMVTDDSFVIFDEQTMKVLIFDKLSGKSIGIVDAIGQGPGEYLNITDVAVDSNGEIWIMSIDKILKFDHTGVFISAIKSPIIAQNFNILPNGELILFVKARGARIDNKKYNDHIFLFDQQGELIKTLMPEKRTFYAYGLGNPLYKTGDVVLVNPRYSDIIYSIDNKKELESLYQFDFGNNNSKIAKKIIKELKDINDMHKCKKIEIDRSYCAIMNYIDFGEYLYFVYRKEGTCFYYGFYSKQSKKSMQFGFDVRRGDSPAPLINDLDAAPYYIFKGGRDNHLYGFVTPDDLMDDENNNLYSSLIKDVKLDDNYIITEFKIKKF